jgi:hypothetical protein
MIISKQPLTIVMPLLLINSVFFVGTHTLGLVEHESASTAGNLLSANQSIPNEYIEESRSVPCPVKAGQAITFKF